ncbi:MAG TPA: hypothetical protein PLA25_07325 [Anaerolineaceae bacterium]|nr:hypothetical protein [Anaerolineaceae bacterium]
MPQTQMDTYMGNMPMLDPDTMLLKDLAATLRTLTKTANYTCTVNDSGTIFNSTGAEAGVTFTLPTPAAANDGCFYGFVSTSATGIAVSCADSIVYDNSIVVDSLTAETEDHIIGAALFVVSNGSKWLIFAAKNALAVFTAAAA